MSTTSGSAFERSKVTTVVMYVSGVTLWIREDPAGGMYEQGSPTSGSVRQQILPPLSFDSKGAGNNQ